MSEDVQHCLMQSEVQFIILEIYINMQEKKTDQKRKYGWEFLFLGANIDAVEAAGRFGISANRAVNYECDSAGTELNYKVLSKAVTSVRCAESAAEMCMELDSDEILKPIREDHAKRGRK